MQGCVKWGKIVGQASSVRDLSPHLKPNYKPKPKPKLSLRSRRDVGIMLWQEKAGARYMYYLLILAWLLELIQPPLLA